MRVDFPSLVLFAGIIGTSLSIPTDVAFGTSASLASRGLGDGLVKLVDLVKDLIENNHNAYDPGLDNTCVISFQTFEGGNCEATVACGNQIGSGQFDIPALEPGHHESNIAGGWNVCYLNGEQFLSHPKVGDFSIKFTQAGGENSDQDGLHHPILNVKQIDTPIDVQTEIDKDEDTGMICEDFSVDKGYGYKCGVPQVGFSSFGLTNTPEQSSTYKGGHCTIHWIEYQIPEGDNKYYLAARVNDNDRALIAEVGNSFQVGYDEAGDDKVDASNPVEITSPLPYVLVITLPKSGEASNTDELPVKFGYADQSFDSNSDNCHTGGYDSGSRQGDCTFNC